MIELPLYLIYGVYGRLSTCDYDVAKALLSKSKTGINFRSNISCIRRKLQVTLLEVNI